MTKSEMKEVEEISLLYFNKMQEFLNASLPGINVIKLLSFVSDDEAQ